MNNEIGGYFGLELRKNDFFLHSDGILLNSGKNALRYIVESINILVKRRLSSVYKLLWD